MANIPFLNNAYFAAKVGIGTDSPDAKLSISDILGISGTGNNTYGQVDLVNTQTGASGDEIGPFITFRGKRGGVDSVIAAYGAIGGVNTGTTGNSTGAITFLTKNVMGAAQDLVEQMRISTGGNVGIGTTSPVAKLHVDDSVGGKLRLSNISATADGEKIGGIETGVANGTFFAGVNFFRHDANDGEIRFRTKVNNTNTDVMTIVDGNVGIGTTSPTSTLTVSSSVGADGSWNKSGILIENTSTITGEPTLAFRNAGTAGTGANYWHTGLNQSNVYKIAYGTSFTDGNTKFELSTNGALRLNSYTQGFLQTDANGNVGLTGGGTLPGGPYLPLAGGTMTGNTVHNDNVKSIYGTASDGLEIYHDGTDSIIADTGTGNLYIRGAASMRLQGINQSNFLIASQGGNVNLYYNNANKFNTSNTGVNITGEIELNDKALLSNQENTNIDASTSPELVGQVSTTYTAAFFDFVVKKTTNVRSGTVYACHDGTNVVFTETSTNDLGDTSDVTLSVDISGTNMRLLATVTSDDWSVKSLIRAI